MTEENIFTSEAALLPDFVPEEPLHREGQLHEMATSLKPVLKNLRPDNLFLYGPPGTGKTTCAKHTAKELSEYKPQVNCIYINCWENNTRLAVLSEIAKNTGIIFPRRGLAGDEVFARIVEISKKNKSSNIIFLDEIDQLVVKKEAGVVYDLSRADENYGASFAVALISNDKNLLEKLDNRIVSSLSPRKIEFPRYSPLELKGILRQRAALCFRSGSWSEEVIALCAANAAKQGGDCRIALRCLWRAARIAESEGGEIKEKHVRKAFEEKETPQLENEVQRKILKVLKEKESKITTGELYEALKGHSERSIRDHLDKMKARNLIEMREVQGKEAGGRGRSRVVKLKG